ncbi:MAG: alpha/beta hydrolase [Deltaproteobacteria bacterium]|nr:alpha/beta hydrolase [Deltaproteobacteria bacterium]
MLNIILDLIVISALGSIVVYGMGQLWAYLEWTETGQDRTDFVTTNDGWRIAIHRYLPRGKTIGKPVILCHGLASNRFIFDLRPAPSLAEFLRANGHDVWVAELRGSGFSERPGILLSDSPASWGFDDHLNYDVSAILQHVIRETGHPSVHWVGHSMGGMLIEAYIARNQPDHIASAVAIGAPADFSKMGDHSFRPLLRVKWVFKILQFNPLIPIVKFGLPFAKLVPDMLSVFFCVQNIKWSIARKIAAIGAETVSSTALWLDMARFLTDGKWADRSGSSYIQDLDASKIPLLAICGTKDRMAPKNATLAVCQNEAPSVVREGVVLGKETGSVQDYGHFDLLIGTRAGEEVFPIIEKWIGRWDTGVDED